MNAAAHARTIREIMAPHWEGDTWPGLEDGPAYDRLTVADHGCAEDDPVSLRLARDGSDEEVSWRARELRGPSKTEPR